VHSSEHRREHGADEVTKYQRQSYDEGLCGLNTVAATQRTRQAMYVRRNKNLPMKMEQTERSETSAYKIHTPGNYPEESIQHLEKGESFESVILIRF
jgi:hypothetical protein